MGIDLAGKERVKETNDDTNHNDTVAKSNTHNFTCEWYSTYTN